MHRLIALIATCILMQSSLLHAQELDEVMKSPEYRAVGKHNNLKQKQNQKQLNLAKDETNFGKVFNARAGREKNLITWIGTVSAGFKSEKPRLSFAREYAMVEQNYKSKDSNTAIKVKVIVPSKSSRQAAELALIPEFSKIAPPGLKVSESEELQINDLPAMLYHHVDGGCSILLRITKGAVIDIKSNSCKESANMINLGENLNIKRLIEKLDS